MKAPGDDQIDQVHPAAVARGELGDRPIAPEHRPLEAEGGSIASGAMSARLRLRPLGMVGFSDYA